MKKRTVIGLLLGFLSAAHSVTAFSDATVALGDNGLQITDSAYTLRLGGRIQLDGAAFDVHRQGLTSGFDARRLWLEIDAHVSDSWSVRFAYDFAAGVTQDAYVRLHKLPYGALSIGQFKPQVGLSEQSSNNYLAFNERAAVIRALAPGRALGVGFNSWSKHTTFSIAVYGDAIDEERGGDDPLRLTSRFAFRPIMTDDRVLHFGTSILYQETADDKAVRFRAKPVVGLPNTTAVIDTVLLGNDKFVVNGVEAALLSGSFNLQGEYLRANVEAPGSAEAVGYYLQATLFTGDVRRQYVVERGTLGGPFLDKGQQQAYEFGLRYDRFDLTDFSAGRIQSWSLAATRYLDQHLKLAFMVAHSKVNGGVAGDESINAVQGRLQWAF